METNRGMCVLLLYNACACFFNLPNALYMCVIAIWAPHSGV